MTTELLDRAAPAQSVLFRYMIVRIGGGPFDRLLDLEIDAAGQLLSGGRDARAELDAARALLQDEVFRAIGGCTDTAVRRLLLSVKRDLHNARPVASRQLEQLSAFGLPSVARYARAASESECNWRIFEAAFEERRARTREAFRKIVAGEAFRKALMLSSRPLFDELPAYQAHDHACPLSASLLHIERALVKYVTRAHAKTSPFSTFGHLAFAEAVDAGSPSFWTCAESPRFESQVRITNSVWWTLRPRLLAVREIRNHLRVRTNPTLRRSSAGYTFLQNAQNIESFKTLPPFDELDRIAQLAADSPPVEALVHRVADAALVEGGPEDVRAFVDRLIAEGFLEIDTGISGTDPGWDLRVISLLRPIAPHCAAAAEVIATLNDVREQLRRFATAGVAVRDDIINAGNTRLIHMEEVLAEAARDPGESAAEARPAARRDHRRLLYEDSALPDLDVRLDRGALEPIAESLADLSRGLTFTDSVVPERAQLAHYCAAKYVDAFVPLIRVYEDYYRDCKIPEQQRKRDSDTSENVDFPGGPGFSADLDARAEETKSFIGCIASRLWTSGRVSTARVDIDREDIAAASLLLSSRGDSVPPFSCSAYIQWILPRPGEAASAVVNNIGPGYGKLMSRFLDMFPVQLTESLQLLNGEADRCILAELRDGTVGNADMHPRLLDFEISSPGAQTFYPPERQIPVSDLWISIDRSAASPRLSLVRESTGQRVEVIDLCFTALPFRSKLFHLLVTGFSRAKYIGVHPLLKAVSAGVNARNGTTAVAPRPRVVYDGRLILQRRSWTITREALPSRQPGEHDASFYLRINDWREAHAIPKHVFVYLTRDREMIEQRKGEHRLSRDDYKPQFISFQDWFTVDLFDRMKAKALDSVLIEEMLPDPDSMLTIAGQRYATEFIVQWSSRP